MNELAKIVLLRQQKDGLALFLLRMAHGESFALPGGAIQPGEDGRVAATRVLFEETGVLLARDAGQAETLEAPTFATLRKKIRAGADATELLRSFGLAWSSDAVMPWSHWLTPSIEAVRTATRMFIAELPGGMPPSAADKHNPPTAQWLVAGEAEAHNSTLLLSPELLRTCWELARFSSIADVFAAARARAEEPHPILPRLSAQASPRCLLMPWDPEYETAGQGESHPFAYQPKWANGPSRFVLEDRTWKHATPGSTNAG